MTEEIYNQVNMNGSKVNLKWKSKRGEGTRDQDEFSFKVKCDDENEAIEKLKSLIEETKEKGLMEESREVNK